MRVARTFCRPRARRPGLQTNRLSEQLGSFVVYVFGARTRLANNNEKLIQLF